MTVPTLELTGSPFDFGYAHGRAYADAIRRYAAERVAIACSPGWTGRQSSREAVLALAEACVGHHRAFSPTLTEELEGMAAATGIPLTHRDHAQNVVLATGHLKDGTVSLDWECLARPRQTIVIYMGLGALEIICRELIAHGLPAATPGAVVHAATTPGQRIVTGPLATLPEQVRSAGLGTPSLIVIGTVVDLHPLLMRQPEPAAASL